MSPLAVAYVKLWSAYTDLAIAYHQTTKRLERELQKASGK